MDTKLDSVKLGGLRLAALLVFAAASGRAQTYTATDLGVGYPYGINNSGQVAGYSYRFNGNALAFLSSSGGTVVDLGTFPGGVSSEAAAINNNGQVAGISWNATEPKGHAFLDSGGTMVDIGTLGGTYTNAYGINDSGQVVGIHNLAGDIYQGGFLYSRGTMIDLGGLGGAYSSAYGINNSGQIVGDSDIASGYSHAFLYRDWVMTDLGTLSGGFNSYGRAINSSGQVAGYSDSASGATHAFLYSGGTMTDLGTPPGGSNSYASGINSSGQIVGYCDMGFGVTHAFLYTGTMNDLNNIVTVRPNVYLEYAWGINDLGQIVAQGSDYHSYLLTPATLPGPGTASLTALNPFAFYATHAQAPSTLNMASVLGSPGATSLAADGESAVVLAYESKSASPVAFSLAATGAGIPSGAVVGSLGQFEANYLASPNPPGGNAPSVTVTRPTYGPDAGGNCLFLVLLWGPNAMPVPLVPSATLSISASQQGQTVTSQASVALEPPPLLLVHGIWANAASTWFTSGSQEGFYDWITSPSVYPHQLVYAVDYGIDLKDGTILDAQSFSDARIQDILINGITDELAKAAAAGMAARAVDVVAHSMGGLVTRALITSALNSTLSPDLLPNPIHKLITIGTPHEGSQLATTLVNKQNQTTVLATVSPLVLSWCLTFSTCTLGDVMGGPLHRSIGPGAQSLEPGSPELQALSPSNEFAAVVGQSPSPLSWTEFLLDVLINAFLPGQSVASILGNQPNDTIVPVSSQSPLSGGQTDSATVSGIVHASICCGDVDEPHSASVWIQAYYWLTGGVGSLVGESLSNAVRRPLTSSSTVSQPVLNLSGYTQVAASNVTFLPASGSTLTINGATGITAASSTKTITEVLLLQIVTDPADTVLLYSTQSPFTVTFTPTRLGSTSFGAITVFSDSTYAMTTLNYTFQPAESPYALSFVNAPVASMTVGNSRVIQVNALSPSGSINVTQVATYTAQSGSASVFSVVSGGTITATGNGVDLLDVSYGGVTATALIPVGACTYALNPTNQIVPSTGGTVTIQVATQSGCAWTATGGASWLPFGQASGSGSGAIILTATANSAGGTQGAIVYLAGLQAFVTQPSTACTFSLSQTQVSAPAAGASGTITATTSCPVTASSNQSWVIATPLDASVQYTVAPNNTTSQRSATLTVGSVPVPVTQAAFNPCDVKQNGSIKVADVQLLVNEALGVTSAVNDLNGDGMVNVADVKVEMNAALGLGCAAN